MQQVQLLEQVARLLERLQIQYAIVGSFASSAYGEGRLTYDIDIVVDLTLQNLEALIANLPAPDFYVSPDAALAAVKAAGQFNVIHPTSGNKIDFMVVPRDEWGKQQLARKMRIEIANGVEAFAAAPEDVIIGKLRYYTEGGSEKHLRDIASMLKASGEIIDRDYIRQWADKLKVSEAWGAVLDRLSSA